MSDIVVVGAGVGGLAAALRLRAAGHRVTVLEQADAVGGKLGVIRHDGFVFDTGPSLVTMPHILRELLATAGRRTDDVLSLSRLDVAARYRFPDGTILDMPGELDRIPGALDAALGHRTGDQWCSFLARARDIWAASREPFLESPVGPGTLIRASRPSDLTTIAPWCTLRDLGRRYLHDPRLTMLLDRYATYSGSDPRAAPAALAAVPWTEQAWGSWYVDGGLGRIAEVLRDSFVELEGNLELGVAVDEIRTDASGRACGVRLGDGTVRAPDLVVANADARQVYEKLLSGPTAARVAARTRKATPSLAGFVLLLALDDPPSDVPHHQVLFAEDYDAEFDAVFGRGGPARPVHRPTVYISAPDDPAIVPGPGNASWFVLVNAPRHDPAGGMDWDETGLAESYADHILQVMADRGLDVRGSIRHRIILTPADLERRTLTPGGSIYGSSSNGARAAFLRPRNASPIPGLYLVGGSAHPGGGLPLVMLSAKIVAGLIGPA
ncbi:phytoene desaturase family protein [Gordonia sp. LSe1-13]|uniref:Phytoene desaturase family protein n=1 Tax=Gordonia sesuvii TaxID=3116777 RepID=A0ABU7MG24_9ACTN|nr:phytoene desaturase family protein [Gordonia sp. LSe1-13]